MKWLFEEEEEEEEVWNACSVRTEEEPVIENRTTSAWVKVKGQVIRKRSGGGAPRPEAEAGSGADAPPTATRSSTGVKSSLTTNIYPSGRKPRLLPRPLRPWLSLSWLRLFCRIRHFRPITDVWPIIRISRSCILRIIITIRIWRTTVRSTPHNSPFFKIFNEFLIK